MRLRSTTLSLTLASLMALTACGEDSEALAPDIIAEGLPTYDLSAMRLSNDEVTEEALAALTDTIRVRHGVADRVELKLNLRNPEHLRLVVLRLHLQGLTPDNYPALYTLLAAQRDGKLPAAARSSSAAATSSYCGYYFTNGVVSSTSTSDTLSANAIAGCSGGADWVYKDQAAYRTTNGSGLTYLNSSYVEEYGEGKYVQPATVFPAIPSGYSLYQDSLVMAVLYDGSFIAEYDSESATPTCTLTAKEPMDKTGDGSIKLCSNGRSGCDYDFTAEPGGTMPVPFSGSYSFIVKDTTGKVLNSSVKGISSYVGKIHNFATGAICKDPYTTVPTVKITNPKSLDINYFSHNYGSQCYSSSTQVYTNVDITGYGQYDGNGDGKIDGSDPTTYCAAPTKETKPYSWIEGCVAVGTEVRLADGGDPVTIDDLIHQGVSAEGLEVITDADGNKGVIREVSRGTDKEVYRLTDELGHSVSVTHTHPVLTPLGPTPAELLQPGDVVESLEGPARLVSVERVEAPITVYNLVVEPSRGNPAPWGAFFADGILVGDQNLQNRVDYTLQSLPHPMTREGWSALFKKISARR